MCILFPRLLQWEKIQIVGKVSPKLWGSSFFRTAVVCSFRGNLGFAITEDFINNL